MNKGKILAIDYGAKNVGFASGDIEHKIAFARDIVENKSKSYLAEKIYFFCRENEVKVVVFGLPLSMSKGQSKNPILTGLKAFIDYFNEQYPDIETEFFDERLSTFEAKSLIGGGYKNEKKHKDAVSAQIILQRWFDEK